MSPGAVDSHHHLWPQEAVAEHSWRSATQHGRLARAFLPTDLENALAAAGVDATVLVQSVDAPAENDRLVDFAARVPFVAGVVGWLPVAQPEQAAGELDRLAAVDRLCGVRCLVGHDPLEWLTTRATAGTFRTLAERGLCWDVVAVTAEQVRAVVTLADRHPDLTVVVDHMARPPVESADWEPWAGLVRELATRQNVTVKLSVGIDVLSAWPAWDATALTPYVAHLLDCFGPYRCMLASNWPVVLLRQEYVSAWRDLDAAVGAAGLTADELTQVRGVTARRTYGLPRSGS